MDPPTASGTRATGGTIRQDPASRQRALIAAKAALEKHAEDVTILDVRSLTTVADYFVICEVESSRQVDAVKERVEAALSEAGCPVWHIEASSAAEASQPGDAGRQPQWMLMDCGEIIVHVLDHATRTFYRLEDLWADAPRIPVEPIGRPPA